MMKVIAKLEAEDRMRMQNQLVELCFGDCAGDMRKGSLTPAEVKCMNFCGDKFFLFNSKVGQTYQDKQADFARTNM